MFNLERYLGEARAVLFSAAVLMQPGPVIEPVSHCDIYEHEGQQYPRITLELNVRDIPDDGNSRWIKFYTADRFFAYGGDMERNSENFRRIYNGYIMSEGPLQPGQKLRITLYDAQEERDIAESFHQIAECTP